MNNCGVHEYKMTTWKGNSGFYYCNDITNAAGQAIKWYTPMRILNLTVDEYINLLLKFNVCNLSYCARTDYLHFAFVNEKDAKAFCSYVNAIARKKRYNCI